MIPFVAPKIKPRLRMEIRLTCIGETKLPFIVEGIAFYQKKLRHYQPFVLEEIPDLKLSQNLSPEERSIKEGLVLLKKLQPGFLVYRLDEHGKMPDSLSLAKHLSAWQMSSKKGVQFLVGGPFGFSPELKQTVPDAISLSALTFPHDLVRLMMVEQLYRACTILKNEPYHHGHLKF
jgi:23S rRNA (pseudouridine1915-N3)-methyltransferase